MTTIIPIIYETKQTVFDLKDLAILCNENNYNNLKSKLSNYVKKGYIYRIRKGIYVKKDFNPLELACRIYTPSYITFETVLSQNNMIFQFDSTIYLASYLSREIVIQYNNKAITIVYRKLKDELLYDTTNVISHDFYSIANADRAVQDMLYLKPDFYFDNNKNGQ